MGGSKDLVVRDQCPLGTLQPREGVVLPCLQSVAREGHLLVGVHLKELGQG